MKKYYKKISSKIFTLKDLKKFAEYSADSNPQHVNPIHARRTISGQCVAHGIYVLMWALDEFTKKIKIPIISFHVDFLKPILIDILICCRWDENNNVLYISQKNVLLTTISIQPGKTIKNTLIKLKFGKARSVPKNLSIEDCKNYEKKIIYYRGKYTIGRKLFPSLNKIYGEGNLVELAATSEYVGMQIPGLNSLYLRIVGDFIGHNKSSKIKVQKIDKRFKIIKLIFKGKYLNAKINIFYSVTHAQMPRIDDFSKLVKFKNYNSVKALIIGGSRGLGEVTAKLVAWGGGESTITYNSGKLDAMRVQKEILRYGGICKIHYLDLRKNYVMPKKKFNQIYFFASPKIKKENGDNNRELLRLYNFFFIKSFKTILTKLATKKYPLKVFYPSTILIDEPLNRFGIYTKVKLRAEKIIDKFEKKNIKIIYLRLPKIGTDQNLSIEPQELHDPVKIIQSVIRRM